MYIYIYIYVFIIDMTFSRELGRGGGGGDGKCLRILALSSFGFKVWREVAEGVPNPLLMSDIRKCCNFHQGC